MRMPASRPTPAVCRCHRGRGTAHPSRLAGPVAAVTARAAAASGTVHGSLELLIGRVVGLLVGAVVSGLLARLRHAPAAPRSALPSRSATCCASA